LLTIQIKPESLGVSGLFEPNNTQVSETDMIDCFNASLLNSGRRYIAWLFDLEAAQICNCRSSETQDAAAVQAEDRRQTLSKELHRPTLAIDECHVPFGEARGVLFHSDYESCDESEVLAAV
jgi:hypothetical protein